MAISTRKRYYLLLADIEDSTSLPPARFRKATEALSAALDSLSEEHASAVALPPRRQYGDEVAGLFTRPDSLYEFVDTIRETLQPIARVRFVVTQGRVGQSAEDVSLVGGNIFKKANDQMSALKAESHRISWHIGTPFEQVVLQSLSTLVEALIGELTEYRTAIWRLFRKDASQKEIADKLRRHPQSISRAIAKGNIRPLIEGEQAIRAVLKRVGAK